MSTRAKWGLGVCLAIGAASWLVTTSNLGQPLFPIFFAGVVLIAVGVWWLVLAIEVIAHRRRPASLIIITPVVIAALGTLGWCTTLPMKARWLATEPAFDAVVRELGPPSLQPPSVGDEDKGWSTVGPCPAFIGTYRIRECDQFPGGYIFWDWAGSGLIDDGGVAYLPQGVPADPGTGWFEDPQFTHLHGHWYAFASSW